jgi:hypothetical protein
MDNLNSLKWIRMMFVNGVGDTSESSQNKSQSQDIFRVTIVNADGSPNTDLVDNMKPKNKGFDVWVTAGQSNGEGNGKPVDLKFDYTDPRILNYSPGIETYSNKLVIAEYNCLNILGQTTTEQIGFPVQFAKEYLAENPDRRVVLLTCCLGNTGFSSNHWKVGDPLYNTVVQHVNNFLSLYPDAELKGILWHQGERDHDNNLPPETYRTYLEEMVVGMRGAIAGAVDVPFICGDYSPEWAGWSSTKYDMQLVNKAITNRLPYTGHVESVGLFGNSGGDVIHFNAASQRELGRRYYKAWKYARTNKLSTPASITGISAIAYGASSVLVSFTPGEKTDRVRVRATIENGFPVSSVETIDNSILLPGLSPDTEYKLELIPINNIGMGTPQYTTAKTNNDVFTTPLAALLDLRYENTGNLGLSGGSLQLGSTGKVTAFNDPIRGNVVRFENTDPGGLLAGQIPATTTPASTLSFCTWVYLEQFANDMAFFAITQGDNPGRMSFGVDEVSGLQVSINGSNIKIPTTFRKNFWQHVGFTIGGGLVKIFVNGIKVIEEAGTITINNTNNQIFVGENGFNYGCVSGLLDNTYLFPQTITDKQMAKLYEISR